MVEEDLARIERAALRAQEYAHQHRHGGLQWLWDEMQWLLEATARLRRAWAERPAQVKMWDG
jgi:hypothetical protein